MAKPMTFVLIDHIPIVYKGGGLIGILKYIAAQRVFGYRAYNNSDMMINHRCGDRPVSLAMSTWEHRGATEITNVFVGCHRLPGKSLFHWRCVLWRDCEKVSLITHPRSIGAVRVQGLTFDIEGVSK